MDKYKERLQRYEEPDGTIANVVKTEWGTFFNIKQTPS